MKIIRLRSVVSTQDEIEKYLGFSGDVAVIAEEQTGGKGTKGRSFDSQRGGLYVTFLIRYDRLPAAEAYTVVETFSVAVAETLISFGVDAKIKWPNDIYASGKKICGMATKNKIHGNEIEYTIIGIGINVNNDLDDGLKDIAISAKDILDRELDVNEVFDRLKENIYRKYDAKRYEELSLVVGKRVKVVSAVGEFYAVAERILPDGRLVTADGRVLSDEEVKIVV